MGKIHRTLLGSLVTPLMMSAAKTDVATRSDIEPVCVSEASASAARRRGALCDCYSDPRSVKRLSKLQACCRNTLCS